MRLPCFCFAIISIFSANFDGSIDSAFCIISHIMNKLNHEMTVFTLLRDKNLYTSTKEE